ncbi:MAG: YvcK family protein [Clostridiales Family XIII bacterium]|nr:YvcK family protein [Clostridiales Family XIII bacterium]
MNITVIGGGTGLAVLLRGLKKIDEVNLTAVVSVADDGGSSGIIREDLGMLPPGDIRSCLLALAEDETGMREILAHRFSEGRLEGQSVGNIILAAAAEIYGNFERGIERISKFLQVRGNVIPVSEERMVLCAELENGSIVIGESQIPKVVASEASRIADVFLESDGARISESARRAVMDADSVVIGPGSLYTSIIPNLLAIGMRDAISATRAVKIYAANVMTQPGETEGMGVADHVATLFNYIDDGAIDYALINDKGLSGDELVKYTSGGAVQLLADDDDKRAIRARGIDIIEGGFIDIQRGYIKHDADAAAYVIRTLTRNRILGHD